MRYYKIIQGQRYDRSLLEAAENFTKGRGEWRISLDEIQALYALAEDGGRITEVEWATLRYIARTFTLTTKALAWINEKLAEPDSENDLKAALKRIVYEEFALRDLSWVVNTEEVAQQLALESNTVVFPVIFRSAILAFLERGLNQLSLESVVRNRVGGLFATTVSTSDIRSYLAGAVIYLVPRSEAARASLGIVESEAYDFDRFWYFDLSVPTLSPVRFRASVMRDNPAYYFNEGYVSNELEPEALVVAIIQEVGGLPSLAWHIDQEEVERQLALKPGQNFGEALYTAIAVGIFNGESSMSFMDFIRDEIWQDPALPLWHYQLQYLQEGIIRLLSLEGDADWPLPPFMDPYIAENWAFGVEFPTKTNARFLVTTSREAGSFQAWNDGFLPQQLSLTQQIQRVVEQEFGLGGMNLGIDEVEFEAQRNALGPSYRTLASLLRQAINTILNDHLTKSSFFDYVREVHREELSTSDYSDEAATMAAISQKIKSYLPSGSLALLPRELSENNPPNGESIEQYWQFYGLFPAFGDIGFWVLIPRWPDEDERPYCYGAN